MKIEDTISSVIQEENFAETVVCITLWISFLTGTLPLESIVDQAWLKLQQVLSIGEKVVLKIKAAGKV